MDGLRTLAQRQRCNTVILRDDNIAPLAEVDQRDIHRVRTSPDYLYLAVIRGQHMIRVAKQHHGDVIFLRHPLGDPRHRAGIRVNVDLHKISY